MISSYIQLVILTHMNQPTLRIGGETTYNPEAAYNAKSFDERVVETREKHCRKSTATDSEDDEGRQH